nr:MAG TPA: Aromatic Amine Dehydrogenase [Caudoviricetes sp.]
MFTANGTNSAKSSGIRYSKPSVKSCIMIPPPPPPTAVHWVGTCLAPRQHDSPLQV